MAIMSQTTKSKRLRWVIVLVAGMLLLAMILLGIGWFESPVEPLPPVSEVNRLTADMYLSGAMVQHVTFDVPREFWPRIWAALQPATRDSLGYDWLGFGHLDITHADGNGYYVGLYERPGFPGVFASGPSYDERVHYRGGNTADLKKALAEAYEAAKRDR